MNKLVVFAILLMLLGTVGASCCVDSNRSSTQNPTTTNGQGHNATLERFVNITEQSEYGNKSKEVVAWLVTWSNDSSVTILESVKNRTDNSSASSNTTLISFSSTQDSTNYLNGLDKSDYSLISTSFKTSDASTLKNVTGHVPSVYAEYLKTEGSIFNLTFKATMLMQYDSVIGIVSAKLLSLGSGVSSASSSTGAIPAVITIPSTSVTPTPKPSATPTPKPSATPTTTPTITPTTGFSVLFFYEPGCPHCANLENSASFAQLQNKVPVQWISNADTQLNNQYGVSGYPTMILLKNGVEVQRFVGDEDATAILARINTG